MIFIISFQLWKHTSKQNINLITSSSLCPIQLPLLKIRIIIITILVFKMGDQINSQADQYTNHIHSKAKYTKTSMKKKAHLIDLVMKQKWSIYKASKYLRISNSTAKLVLENFEKFGVILERFCLNDLQKTKAENKHTEQTPEVVRNTQIEANIERSIPQVKLELGNEENFEIIHNSTYYYPIFPFMIPYYYGTPQ